MDSVGELIIYYGKREQVDAGGDYRQDMTDMASGERPM